MSFGFLRLLAVFGGFRVFGGSVFWHFWQFGFFGFLRLFSFFFAFLGQKVFTLGNNVSSASSIGKNGVKKRYSLRRSLLLSMFSIWRKTLGPYTESSIFC